MKLRRIDPIRVKPGLGDEGDGERSYVVGLIKTTLH